MEVIEKMIPGFERYSVTNNGKSVVSYFYIWRPHQIKINFKNGYCKVTLSFDQPPYTTCYNLHYLVALTFIPNHNNCKFVIHKDGDVKNNHVDNLEWSMGKIKIDNSEVFEVLKDFPKYEINRTGVVRSIKTKVPLKHFLSDGYVKVGIYKEKENGVSTKPHARLHCLLAIQFISNPRNLPVVNHKDGDRGNFSLDNLEWVTSSENSQHAYDIGLTKQTGSCKEMEELDNVGNVIKTFTSVIETCESAGTSISSLSRAFKSITEENDTVVIKDRILRYKIEPIIEGEIWKNVRTGIEKFDEIFRASNLGKIKNSITNTIFKPCLAVGYYHVSLKVKGLKPYAFSVHRLVAFAFLDGTFDLDVNHKNKDKTDNHITNLELLNKKDHRSKDSGKRVVRIKDDEKVIYSSMAEAARQNSLPAYGRIRSLINSRKEHEGYRWKFYTEEDEDLELPNKETYIRGKKVVRIKGDEIIIYPSIIDAAKSNSLTYGMVKTSIDNGRMRKGYIWKFYNEESVEEETEILDEKTPMKDKEKRVVRVKGDERVLYTSIVKATILNPPLSQYVIGRALKSGKERGGYIWEYYIEES